MFSFYFPYFTGDRTRYTRIAMEVADITELTVESEAKSSCSTSYGNAEGSKTAGAKDAPKTNENEPALVDKKDDDEVIAVAADVEDVPKTKESANPEHKPALVNKNDNADDDGIIIVLSSDEEVESKHAVAVMPVVKSNIPAKTPSDKSCEEICLSSDEEPPPKTRVERTLASLPSSISVARGSVDDVTLIDEMVSVERRNQEWEDLLIILSRVLKNDQELLSAVTVRYHKLPKEISNSSHMRKTFRSASVKLLGSEAGGSNVVRLLKQVTDEMDQQLQMQPRGEQSLSAKRMKKIAKLEDALRKVNKKMKTLDEAEVDFDDDLNSSFLLSQRLQAKAVKIYEALCKYKNCSIEGTRRHLVDPPTSCDKDLIRKVEKLLRPAKSGREGDLPEYLDIFEVVEAHNKERNLGLSAASVEALSQSLLKSAVAAGRKGRLQDIHTTFQRVIEDYTEEVKEHEESEKSADFQEKIKLNDELAEKNMENCFASFSKKQEELSKNGQPIEEEQSEDSESESENTEDSEETEATHDKSDSVNESEGDTGSVVCLLSDNEEESGTTVVQKNGIDNGVEISEDSSFREDPMSSQECSANAKRPGDPLHDGKPAEKKSRDANLTEKVNDMVDLAEQN